MQPRRAKVRSRHTAAAALGLSAPRLLLPAPGQAGPPRGLSPLPTGVCPGGVHSLQPAPSATPAKPRRPDPGEAAEQSPAEGQPRSAGGQQEPSRRTPFCPRNSTAAGSARAAPAHTRSLRTRARGSRERQRRGAASAPGVAASGDGAPVPGAVHWAGPAAPPRAARAPLRRPLKGARARPTERQPIRALRARAPGTRGGGTGPVGRGHGGQWALRG